MSLLCMKDICKSFNGIPVLKQVQLTIEKGEVHALLGENGAGKSTLMNILAGVFPADSGEVEFNEKKIRKMTIQQSEKLGIAFVHQELNLFNDLKVYENIFLMKEYKKKTGTLDKKRMIRETQQLFTELGVEIEPEEKVENLKTSQKQLLEISKALFFQAKLLILDEPTAGLDVVARDQILDLLRVYMEQEGRGILISSHISSDLEGLCDDLYMIHEGKIVLHEDMDVLLDQYGLLKVEKKDFSDLDKRGILRVAEESWGYSCLTNEKQFYLENYPGLVVERGSVDEIISMISKGEKL